MIHELPECSREQLAELVREHLLAGHLIDRAGMPQVIGRYGREPMTEVAIDEWMGASPIYSRRMQEALGYAGRDDVETMFKGIQLDIGSPPQFMDFRFRVDDHDHGEFWLDHCGALMDVEPMGEDFVHGMCHTIEDPTFEATAIATNGRARVRPVHRPPRTPADQQPHCRWTVVIDPEADLLPVPAPAARMAGTRAATLALETLDLGDEGRRDYAGPLEDDLDLTTFATGTLVRIAEEVCLQGHLLVMSFVAAVEERFGLEVALEMARQQLAGVGGVTSGRIRRALGLGDDLDAIATVLALHPAFLPRGYVDLRVDVVDERLLVALHPCEALAESSEVPWPALLDRDHHRELEVLVAGVNPRARCAPAPVPEGAVQAFEITLGPDAAPEAPEVELTKFSTGVEFVFIRR